MKDSKIKTFGNHLVNFDIIPDGGTFIDAGACVGGFIDEVISRVKEPLIFGIEPNENNFAHLSNKYAEIPLIKAALVGHGEPKEMEFSCFDHLPEWGNVTGMYGNRKPRFYTVKTVTLSSILKDLDVVHHLKMDVEGCEHKIIATLAQHEADKIQQISMETHNGFQSLLLHLVGLGYSVEESEKGELYAVRKEL
jgi:FkbM family methyltransferase